MQRARQATVGRRNSAIRLQHSSIVAESTFPMEMGDGTGPGRSTPQLCFSIAPPPSWMRARYCIIRWAQAMTTTPVTCCSKRCAAMPGCHFATGSFCQHFLNLGRQRHPPASRLPAWNSLCSGTHCHFATILVVHLLCYASWTYREHLLRAKLKRSTHVTLHASTCQAALARINLVTHTPSLHPWQYT